jgi:hypothetical protein
MKILTQLELFIDIIDLKGIVLHLVLIYPETGVVVS